MCRRHPEVDFKKAGAISLPDDVPSDRRARPVLMRQPICDASSDIIAYEVFANLGGRAPRHGNKENEIRHLEETGAIIEHDLSALRLVTDLFRDGTIPWNVGQNPLYFVNISAKTLEKEGVADQLLSILTNKGTRFKPDIGIEITETHPIEKHDLFHDNVKKLAENGIRVSLDDMPNGLGVGARYADANGYAGYVKIDKAAVKTLMAVSGDVDRLNDGLLKRILGQVLEHKKTLIFEGIEEEFQLNLLSRAFPGALFQGYLFGRPEPIENMSENPSPALGEKGTQNVPALET